MSEHDEVDDNKQSQLDRNIKTQFPVARIKRLMQSDEDVGKVAQATPVVVAKALELFMIQLVDATCEKAKEKNAKRISLVHLYNAVWDEERFDFLRDVMRNYEDQINAEPKRTRGPKKPVDKDAVKGEPGAEGAKPKTRGKKSKTGSETAKQAKPAAAVKNEQNDNDNDNATVKPEETSQLETVSSVDDVKTEDAEHDVMTDQ